MLKTILCETACPENVEHAIISLEFCKNKFVYILTEC